VLFDNDLSPAQIGTLEKLINKQVDSAYDAGIKVLDRSELILDIFASRAQTAEAKLQVELAQLQYTYPRLTRMWNHLERIQSGSVAGLGTRGPGETQLETDRRLVRKRVSELRGGIERVQERKTRQVQARNKDHYTVCVVGYTNAGKSTLFNTLTAAGTYADNKLFATLDTKTRAWRLERGIEVLLSDTVGFVRDLPHLLVASFKATLEEAVHADLLLHVLDVSHPRAQVQYQAVHDVLAEIGAAGKPELLLLNKIDTEDGKEQAAFWKTLHPGSLPISARTGEGLGQLQEQVLAYVRGQQADVWLECDVTNGRLIQFIRSRTRVNEERIEGDTIQFDITVGKQLLEQLRQNEDVRLLDHAPA
jgi:GTP-binding protein HflX